MGRGALIRPPVTKNRDVKNKIGNSSRPEHQKETIMERRNFLKGLVALPVIGVVKKPKESYANGCEFCGTVTEILYTIPKNRPKPRFVRWTKIHTVSCIPCLQKILDGFKAKVVDYGLKECEASRSEIVTTSFGKG